MTLEPESSATVAARNEGEDQGRLNELLARIEKLTGASEAESTPAPEAPTVSPRSPVAGHSIAQSGPAAQSQPTKAKSETKPIAEVERKTAPLSPTAAAAAAGVDAWRPVEPETLAEGGLSESQVQDILLKILIARSEATGRALAEQSRLPFRLVDPLLQHLKIDRLVAHKGAGMMNDYIYTLTELGRERAKKLIEHCSYMGSAPVTLEAYIDSVDAQTLANQNPTEDDLHRAFSDLLIDKTMLKRLGPAINSGRGLFLFGAPGNGKTSIAERVTGAFGEHIWVPRAIGIDGEIMRVFDPSLHEEAPMDADAGLIDNRKIDARWVRIKRPTIVVGGELTMDSLEVTLNTNTNTSEAPLQMKSNCGTLVIDDFGRQRMTTDELLNRWIVPLEKRYDFLNLGSGKKIQVPFDQLIIFSTNLEPKDLVDDAFLRRIPYKIEVHDPDEQSFRKLLEIMAPIIGVEYDQQAIEYLVQKHYREANRPFRCCQPRDLLLQIRNFTRYVGAPPVMSADNFDFAVENYFAVM